MIVRVDEPLLNKFIGPLEGDILRAVWAGKQTSTEITTWLREETGITVSVNHIAVRVRKMAEKGLLYRADANEERIPYHYRAHFESEERFVAHAIARTVDSLIEDYPDEVWHAVARKVTPILKK